MDYMDLLKFLSGDADLGDADDHAAGNPDNMELDGNLEKSFEEYSEVDDDFLFQPKEPDEVFHENEEQPVEILKPEEEPQEPEIDQEEEKFKQLSPAGKTVALIRRYPMDDEAFHEIHALSKQVLKLYTAANKDGATPEEKQKLVLGSFELHRKMTAYFTNMQKKEPEKFNNNINVANLAVAYQYNRNVCANAVEALNGDVLDSMLNLEFTRTAMIARNADGTYSKEGFEDSLARTLYLSGLKAEFDRVHGTEAECRAWRSEILNELLSDRFAENVEKFKETEIYKNSLKNFGFLPSSRFEEIEVKNAIDKGITETAEERYFSVYKTFANGAKDEKEKNAVLEVTNQLEELRLIGENIGTKLPGDQVKNYGSDPLFDTLYVKKRAKIYGEQDNYVSKLTYDKRSEEDIQNRINNLEKALIDELDRDFNKKWEGYDLNSPIVSYIDEIVSCEEKMAKLDQEIKELKEDTQLDPIEKNEALDKAGVSRSTQVILKVMKSGEMFEKFDPNLIRVYDTDRFRQCLKEKKQLEVLKSQKRAEAEKKLRDVQKETLDRIKNEGEKISYWKPYYDDAVSKNNTEEIKKIRGFWQNDDDFYKSRHQELYRPVNCNGKDTYVSIPVGEAKPKMVSAYNSYKEKYGTSAEQDEKFAQALAEYEKSEKLYDQATPIARPDRSNQKPAEFKPSAKGIGSVDLKTVPISNLVHTYVIYDQKYNRYGEYNQNPNPVIPGEEQDPESYLDEAIEPVREVKDVWFGTEEYKRILSGMENLKLRVAGKEGTPAEYAKECRKLLAAMDCYIDRKLDERDGRSREKTNSRNRREAVQAARTNVETALRLFEKQAGIEKTGHAKEEAAEEMQAVLNLSKKKHPQAEEILGKLRDPMAKKTDAINSMYTYLLENVGKYRKDGQYSFRLKENENGGKKRIPGNEDERIFKTVLLAFEKLQNEYLDETNRDNPQNTPLYLFKLANIPDGKKLLGRSAYQVLGILEEVQNKEPDTLLREPENLEDASDQFRRLYSILLTKIQVKNIEAKMRNPKLYKAQYELNLDLAKQMTEAAFSALYFNKVKDERKKAGANAPAVDMAKTEEERRQFISAIRKSDAFEKLLPKCSGSFDVSGVPANYNGLIGYTNEVRKKLVTPEQFRDILVPEALAEDIAEKMNVTVQMLAKPDLYKKSTISKNLEAVEYNLKLAKALGIESKVEKAAFEKTKEAALKADNLKNTIKNVKEEFTARQVKKMDEPVKKISI